MPASVVVPPLCEREATEQATGAELKACRDRLRQSCLHVSDEDDVEGADKAGQPCDQISATALELPDQLRVIKASSSD